jgi:hypothetical protein
MSYNLYIKKNRNDYIQNYLNNNNFVTRSNWKDVGMSQLYLAQMEMGSNMIDRLTKMDVDVKIKEQIEAEGIIQIHDILGVTLPAERYEFKTQNIYNINRYALTDINRDTFRVSVLEDKSLRYRCLFMLFNEYQMDNEVNPYRKMFKLYPDDRKFDMSIFLLKKENENAWYCTKNIIYKDCVIDNISDVDFTIDKLNLIKTDITCRCGKIVTKNMNKDTDL